MINTKKKEEPELGDGELKRNFEQEEVEEDGEKRDRHIVTPREH